MNRPDLIFSYWIFVWYLVYIFGIDKTYNPKFALILGLIQNSFTLFLLLYYRTKIKLTIFYFIMMLLLKIIPLYTVWNSISLWNTTIYKKDVIASIVLFTIYLFWYFIVNKQTLSYAIKLKNDFIFKNKTNTPGIIMLNKLFYGSAKI
jgi:hypothetical protein